MVQRIGISQAEPTGFNITDRHFGGNIIASRYTDDGRVTDGFLAAVDHLDITNLRYPAGQPDYIYQGGLIQNGDIPAFVRNFFSSIEDSELTVTMVTPGFEELHTPEDIRQFAEIVLRDYGERVTGFEVMNEYWQQIGEKEYGQIANDQILAIDAARDVTGSDARIFVQSANASGVASDFHQHPDLGWYARTVEANRAIISELGPAARDAVDGMVEHTYMRNTEQILGDETETTRMLHVDIEIYKSELGQDLEVFISEYNIGTENINQLGAPGASTLIHHMDNLFALEVTEMSAWATQHNTKNDFAGAEIVILDPNTGIVVNTTLGAIYDMVSTSLPGKERLELVRSDNQELISTFAFSDDAELVVYVSSRSLEVETVTFSIGDVFPHAQVTSGLQLGYDQGDKSSDGRHWSTPEGRFVDSDYIMIDGKRFYVNEHDVNAKVDAIDIAGISQGEDMTFRLLPYEVVELKFSISSDVPTTGNDEIQYDFGVQRISALAGNDTIDTGIHDDTVFAGAGDDHVILGAGDDHGFGGRGNDFLSGWGGNDTLEGNLGDDTLRGFHGNDSIEGGSGNDLLTGDDGDDSINGSAGFDILRGGQGDDSLNGGAQADVILGEDGEDQLIGGSGVDFLDAGNGNDTLHGDQHNDTIIGGTGNDQAFGGSGNDKISGDAGFDRLYGEVGNDTISGGAQADQIWGGTGNDVLYGDSGVDQIYGEDSDDLIYGGDHNDTIDGGQGIDRLLGGHGDDKIFGGTERDALFGQSGNDLLDGGAGHDVLRGGTEDDTIQGAAGNDQLFGDSGFDRLTGGPGNDALTGGFNADEFVFKDGHGEDTISDFDAINDLEIMDFSRLNNLNSLENVLAAARQVDDDVVIRTGDQSSIRLTKIKLEDLDGEDFQF